MKYLILLFLSGCAFTPKWESIDGVNVMFTPMPQAECARQFNNYPKLGYQLLGCHTQLGDQHFIIVQSGNQEVYEHERKHVTDGDWHD